MFEGFLHTGTMAVAELSVDEFPGFRNQVHFLNIVHSLSSASTREVFLNIALPLLPVWLCIYRIWVRSDSWLAACIRATHTHQTSSHASAWMVELLSWSFSLLFLSVPSFRTRRKGSVEHSNENSSIVTLIVLPLTLAHLVLFSVCTS